MGARELKPCPFCGSSAEIVHIDEGENAGGSCVSCTRCLASGNVEFGFKENYVSNWNRRADLPTGYVILSPDEVRGIQNALRYAREGLTVAGSMPLSDADTVEAIDAAIKALEARDG